MASIRNNNSSKKLDFNQNVNIWVDAPFEDQKIFYCDLEDPTRTSTPLPGTVVFDDNVKDTAKYASWKKHLHDPAKYFKVRGTHRFPKNEFISGHIVMKDVSENIQADDDLPDLNKDFIRLLLDRPNPEDLISAEDYNIPLCVHTKWISNKQYPICNCNKYSGQNVDLPIGYILDENGLVTRKHVKNINHFVKKQCSID